MWSFAMVRRSVYASFLFILCGAGAQYENCTDGFVNWIQDGWCDDMNNNEGCLFDGGDCCRCTCVSSTFSCGEHVYNCLDPNVTDPTGFICEESPPNRTLCSTTLQREWVVDNTTQARALAEVVSCPGESFNVEWRGKVFVDETISIMDGTVVNITSVGASATMDGGGKIRLFLVTNASLHLRNITLNGGNAVYGGAIAASHSRLTLDRVAFTSNIASNGGGAVWLSNGAEMTSGGNITFWNNTAFDGGALYVRSGKSSASWAGATTFSENTAIKDGGALYLRDSSSSIWTAESHFLSNSANSSGGALYVEDGSNVVWQGITTFTGNTAIVTGGALYVGNRGSAIWTAESGFFSNGAGIVGGALHVTDSNVSWRAKTTFSENTAVTNGGALCMENGGIGTWAAISYFFSNNAHSTGGALYVSGSSTVAWTEETMFSNSRATGDGGAIYLGDGSDAVWTAASLFQSNSANASGGALYVSGSSTVSWTEETTFSDNSATGDGGAMYLGYGSDAVWTATSLFHSNSGNASGGALYVSGSSTVNWTEETTFSDNSATGDGGAMYLGDGSDAVWAAASSFYSNLAQSAGGGIFVVVSSSASWEGETTFSENAATGDGGALYLGTSSIATWTKGSNFLYNNAQVDGGAVYASNKGNLKWSTRVLFIGNTAQYGGALFITNGITMEWNHEANFTSNSALIDGGAVGSRALESELSISSSGFVIVTSDDVSTVIINGTTVFVSNTCGVNGGGMALVQSLNVSFNGENVTFLNNTAGLSGGAVFVAAIGIGTVFKHVTFVENYAQIGGGVHASGSGTVVTVGQENEQVANPTTFEGCTFVSNVAFATGGAVDTASGEDSFLSTVFRGNTAMVGGALRLSGTASVHNCSFIENVSELGEGPAIFNVGYLPNVTGSYFKDNMFRCDPQTFLDFNSDLLYATVCNGCPEECVNCLFGEEQRAPTCTSLFEAEVDHATSEGGTTSLEDLHIEQGYWRATSTSKAVYKCFNTKACNGGVTGALDYCLPGYEGPYCSVCSTNYAPSLGFSCRKCSDRTASIAIAASLTILAAVFLSAVISYLLSKDEGGTGRGVVDRFTRSIPMHSVKIVIVTWQILIQFASVANVIFPSVYQTFLDGVDMFNFDLSWVVSTGCFLEVDFHDQLLWTTIAPIVTMALLGVTYAVAVRKYRGFPETALRNARYKHASMALLVTFLVYSSVSSVVFQMFACDDLEDGSHYLRADYTIECNSNKHKALQAYAGVMILLYPVGIPALYAFLLFTNRHMLRNEVGREESLAVKSISDLWKAYKPQSFYYEVVECGRRILLAGVVVFIYPNTAAQIAATLVIALVFVFVSEGMTPYQSPWDAWISRLSNAIIFASMYLALLLKVDVSGENRSSQRSFETILVAGHGCIILVVVVEAVIIGLSLRRENPREDPRPRPRC